MDPAQEAFRLTLELLDRCDPDTDAQMPTMARLVAAIVILDDFDSGAIRVQLGCSNHHNQPQRLTLGGEGEIPYLLGFPVESCCAPQCAD
jgi:hypothetical protein